MSATTIRPRLQIGAMIRNALIFNFKNLRGAPVNTEIDLLLTRNSLFDKVRQYYATTQPFAERAVPCATVEGLLLLKLYALPSLYGQGNFARVGIYENDIATLLHDYQPDLKPILAELARLLNETDRAAIDEVLADLQRRLERFGRGKTSY